MSQPTLLSFQKLTIENLASHHQAVAQKVELDRCWRDREPPHPLKPLLIFVQPNRELSNDSIKQSNLAPTKTELKK